MGYVKYLKELITFIEKKVDTRILNQDLNPLLPSKKLNKVIDLIRPELIIFIQDEVGRALGARYLG